MKDPKVGFEVMCHSCGFTLRIWQEAIDDPERYPKAVRFLREWMKAHRRCAPKVKVPAIVRQVGEIAQQYISDTATCRDCFWLYSQPAPEDTKCGFHLGLINADQRPCEHFLSRWEHKKPLPRRRR